MKYKTTIFILLSIILVGVFILARYGLFIVYWLTTPNALERTDVEKQLIEHFETRSKLDAIELKPRFKYYIIYLQYKCYNYVNYKYEYKRNYRK